MRKYHFLILKMAITKKIDMQYNHSELDERMEDNIRKLCMQKGLTFIEARDKVLSRYKRFN